MIFPRKAPPPEADDGFTDHSEWRHDLVILQGPMRLRGAFGALREPDHESLGRPVPGPTATRPYRGHYHVDRLLTIYPRIYAVATCENPGQRTLL